MKHVINENVKHYADFNAFLKGIKDDFGYKDAIRWYNRKGEAFSKTFNELHDDVFALARYFDQNGLSRKHIAIISENSYYWIVTYLATAISGGVAVCIDAEQSEAMINQLLKQVHVSAAFISKANGDLAYHEEELKMNIPFYLMEGSYKNLKNVSQLINESDDQPLNVELDANQTASIVFTSGTTGLSKPVMLSHRALLCNGREAIAYVEAGPVVFTSLPLCHTYGMTCAGIATLGRGATLVLNGNLKTVMRDLQNSNAYSMLTVPLMVEAIHNQLWLSAKQNHKDEALKKALKISRLRRQVGMKRPIKELEAIKKQIMGDLRVIICGGAHMSKDIAEEFEILGVTMLQGYGITECSPLVAVNGNHACKLSSVGLVLPSCEVKIVDEEIYVKGVNLMNGYYGMPEETEAVMEDGWFKTGDLGQFDKDGFLYITGRKKNLIVFKNGKKVSPESIEEKLMQIPLAKDVVIYGAASGLSADDVKLAASIFPDPVASASMSSYEILESLHHEINLINRTLPLYQQVQMINIRDDEFEKTSMQKIKRHLV